MNKRMKKILPLTILLMVLISVLTVACNVEKAKVTYLSDDGATQYGIQEVEKDAEFTANQTPTKDGYILKGWATSPTKDKTQDEYTMFDFPAKISEDITLYVVWQVAPAETFSVTFKVGETIIDTQSVEKGGSAALPEDGSFEIPVGKVFAGWDREPDNITADTVINAILEDAEYTVTFHDVFAAEDKVVGGKHGDTLPNVPGMPVRAGYTFDGWFYSADNGATFGNKYAAGNFTQDSDVYALYSLQSVSEYRDDISLNANKGSYTYGDPVRLTSAVPGYAHIVYSYEWRAGDTLITAVTPEYTFTPDAGAVEYTLKITAKSDIDSATITTKEDEAGIDLSWSATVKKASLTITADAKEAVFGDAVPSLTYACSGFKLGDTASDITAGTITTDYTPFADAGEYAIIPAGFGAANYDITYADAALTVTPFELEVAINGNKTFDNTGYRADSTALNGIDGLPDWLKFTEDSHYRLKKVDAESYRVTEILAPDSESKFEFLVNNAATAGSNIILSYNITITIDKADITEDNVIVTEFDGTYDGKTHKLSVEFNGLLGKEDSTITGNDDHVHAGKYTNTCTLTFSNNYNEYTLSGGVNISPESLSIVVDDKSLEYGGELTLDKEQDIHPNGFVSNEEKDAFFNAITISTAYHTGDNAGEYSGSITFTKWENPDYSISITGGSVTVNQRELTVTPDSNRSKVYGEADKAFAYTVSNIYNGEEIIFTGAPERDPGENVGSYSLDIGSLTLADNDINKNYKVTWSAAEFKITERRITIGITDGEHHVTYGNGFDGADILELKDGTSLAFDHTLKEFFSVQTNYDKTSSSMADCEIWIEQNAENELSKNYIVTIINHINNPIPLSIDRREVTLSIDGQKVYNGEKWSSQLDGNVQASGLVNGDTFSGTISTIGVGEDKKEIVYDSPSDFDTDNVTILNKGTDVKENYTIAFDLKITVKYSEIIYGVDESPLTYDADAHTRKITVNEGYNNAAVTYSSEETGVYTDTAPSFTNAGDYTVYFKITADDKSPVSGHFKVTIRTAALTITAKDQSVTYGDSSKYGVTYNGFVGSENESVLKGVLEFECDYTAGSNVGEYTLTPSGQSADNYNITYNPGTITVVKKTVTVTLVSPGSVYGEEVRLNYTIGGVLEKDSAKTSCDGAITLTDAVNNGAYVSAGSYTVGLGTLAFTDSDMRNNYNLIMSESAVYTVTKAKLTVSFSNPSVTYNQDISLDELTLAYNGFVDGENAQNVDISIQDPGFATDYTKPTVVGASQFVTPTGTFTADNYEITPESAALTINKAKFTNITHESLEGTYSPDKTLNDYALNASGYYKWVRGDTIPTVPHNDTGYAAIYNRDPQNYEDYELYIQVILTKATPDDIKHSAIDGGVYASDKTLKDYTLETGYSWAEPDTKPTVGNSEGYAAIYNPDPANYNDRKTTICITLTKAETSITEGNTITAKFAGENRAADGTTSVKVNFDFADTLSDGWSITLTAGEYSGLTLSNNGVINTAPASIDVTSATAGTFAIGVTLTDVNYTLNAKAFIILKLTSVAIFSEDATNNYSPTGLSDTDYYTIEDALNMAESGQVLVVTSNTSFTNDSRLTNAITGCYNSGSYCTVKSGVKVLLPYGLDADTSYYHYGYEAAVNNDAPSLLTKDSPYVNLYLSGSTTLNVEGTILVNALRTHGTTTQANGVTYLNNYAYFTLGAGAGIKVLSGGELTSIGYIINEENPDSDNVTKATIDVAAGGAVRDTLVLPNFKGGTISSNIAGTVFPVSQFYINNIEVDTVIHYGGTMYANSYVSSPFLIKLVTDVVLIGNTEKNFIQINQRNDNTDNYILKTYDPKTGRIGLENHGDVTYNDITVNVGVDLSTAGKELPIPYNFGIYGKSGSKTTINSRVKLLPGSICEIDEGAEVILNPNSRLISYGREDIAKLGADGFLDGGLPSQIGYPDSEMVANYYRTNVDLGTEVKKTPSFIKVEGKLTLLEGARIAAEIHTDSIDNISVPLGTMLAANTRIGDSIPWKYYESSATTGSYTWRFNEVKTRIYINGELSGYPFVVPDGAAIEYADVPVTINDDFYKTLNAYISITNVDGSETRIAVDETNSQIYKSDDSTAPITLVNGKVTQTGDYNVVISMKGTSFNIPVNVEDLLFTLNTTTAGEYATGVDLANYGLDKAAVSINGAANIEMTLTGVYDSNDPSATNRYDSSKHMIDPNLTGNEFTSMLEFQFLHGDITRTVKIQRDIVKLGVLTKTNSSRLIVYNNRTPFSEKTTMAVSFEDPAGKTNRVFKETEQTNLRFTVTKEGVSVYHSSSDTLYANVTVESVTDANGNDMSRYYENGNFTVKGIEDETDLYFHLSLTDPKGLIQYRDMILPVIVQPDPRVLVSDIDDQSTIRVGSSLVDKIKLDSVPDFESKLRECPLKIIDSKPVLMYNDEIKFSPTITVDYKNTYDGEYQSATDTEYNPATTEFLKTGWYKVKVECDEQVVSFEVECWPADTFVATSSQGPHEYSDNTQSILEQGWDLGAACTYYTNDGEKHTENLRLEAADGKLVLTDGAAAYAVNKSTSQLSTDGGSTYENNSNIKLDNDFSLITYEAKADDYIKLKFYVTVNSIKYNFEYVLVNKVVQTPTLTPTAENYGYMPSWGGIKPDLTTADTYDYLPSVTYNMNRTTLVFKMKDNVLNLYGSYRYYPVKVKSCSEGITLDGTLIQGWTSSTPFTITFTTTIDDNPLEFTLQFVVI